MDIRSHAASRADVVTQLVLECFAVSPCIIITHGLVYQFPFSAQRLTKVNERLPPAQLNIIFMGTVSAVIRQN